ncbi:MAG: hypothetical protein AB1571_02055 [Nanoarchaeota archaeon]
MNKLYKDALIIENIVWKHRNTALIILSIIVAIVILRSEAIFDFIHKLGNLGYIGVFLSGIFFSYGLTTAPAISILYLLAKNFNSIFLVALIGSLGALLSDYIIFTFIKYGATKEIRQIEKELHIHPKFNRGVFKFLRKIAPLIGGILIASPLPDELAIAVLGTARIRDASFLIISYIAKFFGIIIIAGLANLI